MNEGNPVSLLNRLFGPRPDDLAEVRPLWQRVIELARDPAWFAKGGLADTVSGRFDAITLVLALVLIRMERDPVLVRQTGRLTELFVADIDGQLRELGVGDPVMAKRMGKLISHFGGRLDAWRAALAGGDAAVLAAAVERNVTFAAGEARPELVAERMRSLSDRLAALDSASLLTGRIPA
jgi:cytochrome b pre-mRNA-processing protein 3